MAQESQEAKVAVAVAVNDIEWLKESQRSTNRGIEQLQLTLTKHMNEQAERSEKFATKEELNVIKTDVEKLKAWRWKVGGALALGSFILGLAVEGWRMVKG